MPIKRHDDAADLLGDEVLTSHPGVTQQIPRYPHARIHVA